MKSLGGAPAPAIAQNRLMCEVRGADETSGGESRRDDVAHGAKRIAPHLVSTYIKTVQKFLPSSMYCTSGVVYKFVKRAFPANI